MLQKLKDLNPDIKIYSIHDDVFEKYGEVMDFDAT